MNKSKSTQGFTLVEIIVVLVILAILAATLIPTMLGFIQSAEAQKDTAAARTAYLAMQTIALDEFGTNPTRNPFADDVLGTPVVYKMGFGLSDPIGKKLEKLLAPDIKNATVVVGRVVFSGSYINPTTTGWRDGKVFLLTYITDDNIVVIEEGKPVVVTAKK